MASPNWPAKRRAAAIQALHADVLGDGPAPCARPYDGTLHLEVPVIAARMRGLADMSRSPRWGTALEQWALMIEREAETGHAYWAYMQGSIDFGYRTEGL